MNKQALALALAVAALMSVSITNAFADDQGGPLSVSVPVTFVDGNAFWGGYVDYLPTVAPHIQAGIETGFQIWSDSEDDVSANEWVVPILLTGLYNFDIGVPAITPFAGLGLGVAIAHASVDLGGGLNGDGTEAVFEGLVHGGVKFGPTKKFFFDMRLGIIDSSFAIAPSVGFSF